MARTRGGKRHLGQYRRRSQTSSSSGSQLCASGGEGVSARSAAPRVGSDAARHDQDGTPPTDIDIPTPALSLTAAELAKTRRRANRVDDELKANAHGNNRAVEDTESSENSESDSEDEWTGRRRAPILSRKTKEQKAGPTRSQSRSRSVSSRSESECSAPPQLPRRTRSVSVQGYTWESERLSLTPVDIEQRLSYHKVFKTTTGGRNGSEAIKFRRDDLIYVLPDPAALDKRNGEEPMAQEDLPDEEWAVAQIADCCLLKSASCTGPDLPMLRVRWMYTPDEAKGVANLHKSYKARLDRYKFGDNELIYTDHFDFIPLDCYAGISEDHFAHVELLGLEVADGERVGPEEKRSSKTLKEYVWMTGFDSKKKGQPPITKDASRNARSAESEHPYQEGPKTAASSEQSETKKRKASPGGQGKRITKKAKESITSSS